MTDDPIFILGTERSGSNLLRAILNAHSRIVVPHPPHIVRYFAPLEAGYGDLTEAQNFAQLADDILTLVRLHIHPWGLRLDRARLLEEAEPRNVFGLFVALYEQYRAHAGKARWGCKSTFMIGYSEQILAHCPGARLILLTRDPRDVAVSSRQAVFNPFHPYFTARLWAEQQALGLALRQRLSAGSLLHLRYEDLLVDTEASIRRLCEFIDEPFEPAMLQYFATAEARRTGGLSESWKNTARPILTGNAGRYRSLLSRSEQALVEQVARGTMEAFGYSPELEAPGALAPTRLTLFGYRLLDLWWRCGVELRSLFFDRNHWRRWGRDLWALYLGLRRG